MPGQDTERRFTSALIVDDHPLFCDALGMTLKAVAGIEDIVTVNMLSAALDALSDGADPDLIVLDLNLPDVNGMDGLLRLRTAAGNRPIMVVSSMADNRVVSSVKRAGAQAFVPKHSQRGVIRTAIEALSRGEAHWPSDFVEVPDVAEANGDAMARISTLTNQQARILQLICEGKLNKQIAYDLSIAETTVKAHVTAIMRKLGVQSRTQAVLIAAETSFSNLLQDGPEST